MKVKCCNCKNESNRKCVVKNITIKPNKSRSCNDYEFDQARELVRLKRTTAIRRRYDDRQAAYREFQTNQMKKVNEVSNKHPMTGNLDRFKAGV